MPTNETERDFTERNSGTKRPGRIDPRLFNNIPDAGDGYPGLQRMIRTWARNFMRNYMQGGMPFNINMNNHDIIYIDNLEIESINHRIFFVTTNAELTAVLDYITAQAISGKVLITNSITDFSYTVNAPGSSFIVEGFGNDIVIDADGANTIWDINACESFVLRNVELDVSTYTALEEAIDINEASDNRVLIENVTIIGTGADGRGVWIESNNVSVINCYIDNVNSGIQIFGASRCIVADNIVLNCVSGIAPGSSSQIIISDNNVESCNIGIFVVTSTYITITGNMCFENTIQIQLRTTSNYNLVSGNNCYGSGVADTGIEINAVADTENTIVGNLILNHNTNYVDNGTNTYEASNNRA